MSCIHEQDFGKIKADVHTAFLRIDELKQAVLCLNEQNVAIAKLSLNLEHLVAEVRENNANFQKIYTNHDERLEVIERAEGEHLKHLKQRATDNTIDAIVKYLVVALISGLVGIFFAGVV